MVPDDRAGSSLQVPTNGLAANSVPAHPNTNKTRVKPGDSISLNASLRDARTLLTKVGGLFESVGHLEHTEILFVAADDLQTHRKSLGRKAGRHRGGRISRSRNVPTRLHPVNIVL